MEGSVSEGKYLVVAYSKKKKYSSLLPLWVITYS